MSVVTHGELLYGAEKHVNRISALKTLDELVTHISVLPMSTGVAHEYARLRAALEKNGEVIGNNEREFKRVPRLRVENWASQAK